MNTIRILLILTLLTGLLNACDHSISERAANDEVTMVAKDDPAMQKAFDKARQTLPDFLQRAAQPAAGSTGFSVKIRLSDGANDEYFWVEPFTHSGAAFSGTLANDGELIQKYRAGQTISFAETDIVDWLYHDEKTRAMRGNYTACALLTHEDPKEATAFKKEYGLDCSDF